MRSNIFSAVLLQLSFCIGLPIDETAITRSNSGSLASDLPPFDVPMEMGPNGWTRIQQRNSVSGPHWETGNRVNHFLDSGVGRAHWDKMWPTHDRLTARQEEQSKLLSQDVTLSEMLPTPLSANSNPTFR